MFPASVGIVLFAVDGIASRPASMTRLDTCRHLFRVPVSVSKVQPSATNPNAIILANQAAQDMGETGNHADAPETDNQGFIYLGAPGSGSAQNTKTGRTKPYAIFRVPIEGGQTTQTA
ncbi:hypothetical protein C8Q77DRAFT_1156563 [Trametes polyzona]|nr:hypothetical protein C8Q77DRAFT_1156563 [Trametes polyzona]